MYFLRNRNRRVEAAVAALSVLAVSSALAQRALDANLNTLGGGVNQATPQQSVNKPIFTVNRTTGDMSYNRANAFNDDTYRIYQRYTLDRFEYFDGTKQRDHNSVNYQDALQKPQTRASRPSRANTTGRVQPAAYVPRGSASRAPARNRNTSAASRHVGRQHARTVNRGRASSLKDHSYSMHKGARSGRVSNRVR